MPANTQEGRVRIGELSRRVGVTVDTLRAWERRYGLLAPERSQGGFRLYGEDDTERAREMKRLIEQGVSAAEAAATVRSRGTPPPDITAVPTVAELCDAISRLDEEATTAIIDRAVLRLSIEGLLRDLVLPAMREVGERWRAGQIGVGEEHFATNLLRGRLIALSSGWGSGSGPRAVLACPPGEQHDLGLVAFGLILHRRGWRIAYLGADTPLETLAEIARRLERPPVVLAASEPARFEDVEKDLRRLARESGGLYLGGAGAEAGLASAVGASVLDADPVAAAIALSASA